MFIIIVSSFPVCDDGRNIHYLLLFRSYPLFQG